MCVFACVHICVFEEQGSERGLMSPTGVPHESLYILIPSSAMLNAKYRACDEGVRRRCATTLSWAWKMLHTLPKITR